MKKTEPIIVNGQRFKLKQCEVTRIEDEFGHSYMINDEPVAGVTTLLSLGTPVETGLLEYFKRTDKETQEDILADAQDRGSNVHHAIERLLNGDTVESGTLSRKREKMAIAAFVDFFQTVQPTQVVSEQVVAYMQPREEGMPAGIELIRYAGTLDFIATINGKRVLIDFKTGTVSSRKHELQVEAYKAAVEQSSDEKIDRCYVLHLGTSHKGTRSVDDDYDIPSTGVGWNLERSYAHFSDFNMAYNMALFMSKGVYPKPPKVTVYPDVWQILTKQGTDE